MSARKSKTVQKKNLAWKSKTVQKKKLALKSKTVKKKSSRRVTFKNDKETLMKPPGNILVFNTRNSVSDLLSSNKKIKQEYSQIDNWMKSKRIKSAWKRKTGKKPKRKRRTGKKPKRKRRTKKK